MDINALIACVDAFGAALDTRKTVIVINSASLSSRFIKELYDANPDSFHVVDKMPEHVYRGGNRMDRIATLHMVGTMTANKAKELTNLYPSGKGDRVRRRQQWSRK